MKNNNIFQIILALQFTAFLIVYIFIQEELRDFIFFTGVMCYLCQITMMIQESITTKRPDESGEEV